MSATNQAGAAAPRTLVISDRYLPELGGSFTWFHNVYTRLPAGSVHFLTNSYPNAAEIDATFPQIRMHRVALKHYRFLKPQSLVLYAKLFALGAWICWRHGIQVIHAGKNLPEGFVARKLSKLLRIPYVVYAHGEEITIFGRNPRLRPHLAAIYTDAAAIITNSAFTRSLVLELGVEKARFAMISPGVDPDEFKPLAAGETLRQRLKLEGKLVLLTVGRLQQRKGHDQVIAALPAILQRIPQLVYVIAGDGEERKALEDLAREKGVAAAVHFLGRVPQAELPTLYNAADIFIMANRTMPDGDVEGFGIVFLEAGACKKPVIAGDSGGTADAVEEGVTGLRVDGTSPGAIAAAVLRLALDPALRQRMGESGRSRVVAEYSWAAIAEKTLALSREITQKWSA